MFLREAKDSISAEAIEGHGTNSWKATGKPQNHLPLSSHSENDFYLLYSIRDRKLSSLIASSTFSPFKRVKPDWLESPGFSFKVLMEKAHWLKSADELFVAASGVTGISEQWEVKQTICDFYISVQSRTLPKECILGQSSRMVMGTGKK